MMTVEFMNQAAFTFGAILITLFCMIYEFIQNRTEKPSSRLLLCIFAIHIVACVCHASRDYFVPMTALSNFNSAIYRGAVYIYFIVHNLMPAMLFIYTVYATQTDYLVDGGKRILMVIPALVSEGFIIANPVTGLMYTIDENFVYRRGTINALLYVNGIIYAIASIIVLMFIWKGGARKKKRMIFITFMIMSVGIIIQMIIPSIHSELLGEAVLFLGLIAILEHDELKDMQTGLGNRSALIRDMRGMLIRNKKIYIICIRLCNIGIAHRLFNVNEDEIIRSVSDSLKQIHPAYLVYRVMPNAFMMVIPKMRDEQRERLIRDVNMLFGEGVHVGDEWVPLRNLILVADYPDRIKDIEDMLLLSEVENDEKTLKSGMVSDEDLDRMFELANMNRTLRQGVSNDNYAVFYQPAYDPDTRRIVSAEALVRYRGKDFVARDFIRMAERNGAIMEIGDYVLNEVCDLISTGILRKYEMSFININVSIIQCMSPDFTRRCRNILLKYPDVNPENINFEIMETVADRDYKRLALTIDELKEAGFKFSVEGFGSGYSNMYSVFAMNLDDIKMDKDLLWYAERDNGGLIVLENSVKMIHDMGRTVTIVGVESEEHMKMIKTLGAESCQGFYLSKPLTRTQLLDKLIEQNKPA